MKIVHVITGLGVGGAEMMLYKLISSWPSPVDKHWVISISDEGIVGASISNLNTPVIALGMRPGRPTIRGVWQYISTIRKIEPDVLQGWMYHGNLAVAFACRFLSKNSAMVWNVRQSLVDIRLEKMLTQQVIRIGRWESPRADTIIYNSETSRDQHVAYGYCDNRSFVVPNGFDLGLLKQDNDIRQQIRSEMGITPDIPVVGMVARLHPMKDHSNFFDAAQKLAKLDPRVIFVLAGRDVDWRNEAVAAMVRNLPKKRVYLLGERDDIPKLMNIFDVLCTSSAWGEAFPNVLGEAMATGLPCVATDVGDSALIVGDVGRIVPVKEPHALAVAVHEMLTLTPEARSKLSLLARQRIEDKFSIGSVVHNYQSLYQRLVSNQL